MSGIGGEGAFAPISARSQESNHTTSFSLLVVQ